MNLDEAVRAHAAWKTKLSSYLRHPDRSINPVEAGWDDACPLGQWLNGEAKRNLSGMPEYQALVAEHTRFHQAFGKAVERADAGEVLQEEEVLGWDSEFGIASREIVQLIVKLKKKAAIT